MSRRTITMIVDYYTEDIELDALLTEIAAHYVSRDGTYGMIDSDGLYRVGGRLTDVTNNGSNIEYTINIKDTYKHG